MPPSAASDRLRELQLQAARDSAVLASDFEPAGPSRLPVSSSTQRVASDSAEDFEGRPLVTRHATSQVLTSRTSAVLACLPASPVNLPFGCLSGSLALQDIPVHTWRIWFAVFAALVASIFLLWLLFGADDTQLVCQRLD